MVINPVDFELVSKAFVPVGSKRMSKVDMAKAMVKLINRGLGRFAVDSHVWAIADGSPYT